MVKFVLTEWLGAAGVRKEYGGETVDKVVALIAGVETQIYGGQEIDIKREQSNSR